MATIKTAASVNEGSSGILIHMSLPEAALFKAIVYDMGNLPNYAQKWYGQLSACGIETSSGVFYHDEDEVSVSNDWVNPYVEYEF